MSTNATNNELFMRLAIANAATARLLSPPNPWVGAVVVANGVVVGEGSTQRVGGDHAEVMALRDAGEQASGATLYCTLEPCAHQGRTGPCTDALIEAGVTKVVIGITDPDTNVGGRGVQRLRDAGIDVEIGVCEEEITEQLRPYLTHRRLGRPHVVLKLAASLDGRIAAPDGSSQWITGAGARVDAHRLRAESDAVVVGAGTVRADNPSLTVRDFHPTGEVRPEGLDPERVVLGPIDKLARVLPARSLTGDLGDALATLSADGVLQVLVEGGANVAWRFHSAGLVDDYVIYLAPVLFGGDDARPMFAGPGVATMAELWRGSFHSVTQLGEDVRLILRTQ